MARVLPRLLTAIEEETRYAEDRFQAMVCVGWLHWAVGEYNLAAVRLPKVGEHEWRSVALPPAAAEEGGGAGAEAGAATGGRPKSSRSTKAGTTTVITANEPSEWTRVCALKAAYLRANCLERCNELQPQSQQQQQQQQQQTVAEGSGAAADAAALSPLPKSGGGVAALAVFEAALPSLFPPTIATPQAAAAARSQLRYWSELFLMEFCMLQGRALRSGDRSLRDPNSLACFRAWARYWETTAATSSVTSSFSAASSTTSTGTTLPAGLAGGFGFRGAVPRRRVWYEYYQAVSGVVAADLPFPPTGAPAVQNHDQQVVSARSQLRAELKRVEAAYETLLLAETTFPRADEDRDEVETFVDLVVQNWTVLAGRGWREQDLGSGGREGLARSVLDMLYRASTRTFHSTAILRHLFTLHVAVAEFDLAFKAFDAYRDIVLKGRARVEKTGHAEPNLDSDATILETMALAVTVCCRYGPREAVEKARGIADELEQWIGRAPQGPVSSQPTSPGETLATMTATTPGTAGQPPQHLHAPGNGVVTINGYHGGGANGAISFSDIPPAVQSTVWQAVGMAHATWSRVTFDASARTDIQAKAIQCLRRSLAPELGRSRDVRALFALALLLAERRELGVAIDVVKSALMAHKADPDEGGPSGAVDANVSPPDVLAGPYWQERLLVPLWHLLALLLSAKQEYLLAARACEGAFEQFKDPAVLFGSADLSIRPQQPRQQFRSDHLNEAERQKHGGAAAADERPRGLVDEMDDFEKEGILEIKMTQLALVELMEGPDVAVNASYELLSLFARLFGPVDGSQPAPVQQKLASAVPKSSAGTLRSIKGSIFGRSDRPGNRLSRQASSTSTAVGADRSAVSAASRPQTQQRGPPTTESSTVTQAPTIHVTQERTTTATTTDGGRRSRRASVSRPPPSASTLSHRRSESAKRASLQKRDSSGAMPGRRTVSSSGIPRHAPTAAEGESYVTSGTDEPRRQNGFYKSSGGGGSANTGNNVNRQSSSNLNRQPSTLSATGTTKGTNSMPHMDSHMSSKFTGGTVDLSEQLSAAVAAGARRGPKRLTISTLPVTQFPRDQEKKRRTVILVKVWLMIAGFYRRASMYDDCKGAISEAQKLVKSLEADVTRDAPGTASLRNAGWACRKSVDELSGDVYAEVSSKVTVRRPGQSPSLTHVHSSDTCLSRENHRTSRAQSSSWPSCTSRTILRLPSASQTSCSISTTRRCSRHRQFPVST